MIIGLSGYKQSGKDTVCKIIQYLMYNIKANHPIKDIPDAIADKNLSLDLLEQHSGWENRKFADKVKEMICILLGCTREQLEDEKFKEIPLGEEWDCWLIPNTDNKYPKIFPIHVDIEWIAKDRKYVRRRMTPRMLLQLLGTEWGRNIIHPNIWVNALMTEYKSPLYYMCDECEAENILPFEFIAVEKDTCPRCKYEDESNLTSVFTDDYSNWIISDVRFPNEAKAIKDRNGIIIRIEKQIGGKVLDLHESETALDNYLEFDDKIYNYWDIPTLVETVSNMLRQFKIIK